MTTKNDKNTTIEKQQNVKPKLTKEQKVARKEAIEKLYNSHKVNVFNVWRKFPKKIGWTLLSAILYNVAIAIFLSKAATVASGVAAFAQAITFTLAKTAPYYAFIYFAINLPLIIGFWKKTPRLFMILTLYWLIFQMILQAIFLITPIKNFINNFSIYYINWEKGMAYKDLIPWNVYGLYRTNFVGNPTWPIIIYTLIGGILAGCAVGIAWKHSGSTAGSDIIVYYVSRAKQKNVGTISTIVALLFALVSIVIVGATEGSGINKAHPWNLGAFILRIVSTVVYIFVYNLLLDLIYPKYKKIKIEIYTKKAQAIIDHLTLINYWHGYNYSDITSGYSKQTTTKIETTALYLEFPLIKNEIIKIDPTAWMNVIIVNRVVGSFDTTRIE